ncbi:heterodisulfide reductase, subunit A/methylviologen reducing hydrogenase, subunit delta [Olavius algarvensis associated proteobacterium Delta 3]|nr:heterodisulfide reductase, subunit A/methylviologen reducing hydrogenase, subunit delta [Olavius algarvensis associated proteobacterium Delta 3]
MNRKIGRALVVGGGISGIRAALDLAETGYGVTLIDHSPHIGGILSQLDVQFPTNHCGMCKMLPLVERDAASQFCLRKGLFHENIDILLNTDVSAVDGEPGNFTVSLREKPTWVDPRLCVGCGVCEEVCPVDVPDAFNEGLSTRKAIYLPVPHNIPNAYVIDLPSCTHCGECERVCPTDAIRLQADRRKEFRILVVDDEQIVRDSLKAWLEDEDFSVDTAESGPAALEKLAGTTVHLMLTDIKMPGMDGVELLKAAREVAPDLCVLMMTAYATVETAVEAMKIGAEDYLVKPFDPEQMIPKVVTVYEHLEAGKTRQLDVGAIVFCGGTDYFHPADEKNVYGYNTHPGVMTSLEFERVLSGTGPSGGRLVRPHDGKPVEKIAWLQCVGSRDVQSNADFCSSICCMVAIKEAMLARERGNGRTETAIFYMDMRTFGKPFQRYRDQAEKTHGVRFERGRVHSVHPAGESGDPLIRYVRLDGSTHDERFDLVILAVGQRPSKGTREIAELTDIPLNTWGFVQTDPFLPARTDKPGLVVGGSYSGLKDISESVICASAASLEASRVIHAAGGSLAVESPPEPEMRDVSREHPKVLAALCTCSGRYAQRLDVEGIADRLERDPCVDQVLTLNQCCTTAGWEQLAEAAKEANPNRILIGACHPYLFIEQLRELARHIHLDAALMDVVDIMSPVISAGSRLKDNSEGPDESPVRSLQTSALEMALSRLRHLNPVPAPTVDVTRRALVIGGGIAEMHGALAIADHGYPVDLVEQDDRLGGNLHWLSRTIDGQSTRPLLEETVQQIEKHPHIDVHLGSRVADAFGEVGQFHTTLETGDGEVNTVSHGAVLLATGGTEAPASEYGYGTSEAIVTQMELESRITENAFDPTAVASVVMIQCVGSREEPRNYCSRVCCPTSLKQMLYLKQANPDIAIYVLYRDMMACGFTESYFTEARRQGVMFIQYSPEEKPDVHLLQSDDYPVEVSAFDPVLGRPVEIGADLLVLATGVVPRLPENLARFYGAGIDTDGFFDEAESKWRPVDSLKEGVFACGLALSPRSIPDSIATAGAAAQRCLRILSHERMKTGKVVSAVRHSLCSLCERCIETCPYNARSLPADLGRVAVNPAMCQGCGECASVCPNSASVVHGFSDPQMFDVIDAALESAL